MKIPKRLSKAMDSLTVNHEWGGINEMPEDILDPDDWRLQEIMKFRKELKLREPKRIKEAERRIKQYFYKHNINNPFSQAYILRKIGTKQSSILKLTGLSKHDYYLHVGSLFRNTGNYRQLRITDVEVVLTQEKISDILKDANSKIKG
ncbi:hypothetical protein NM958_02380 [Limosilactobacillus reuteri]|uniref:hypothetical protein n=1 Tax=Limosilactobacillus reuteri TaxID=1598 RepID=UPI0039905A9C